MQVRVCTLLTTALQNLLDPACEPALQASDLRCVLRCVRTVLHSFYRQLRSKCGVFVETLLAGERRLIWLSSIISYQCTPELASQLTHMHHCAPATPPSLTAATEGFTLLLPSWPASSIVVFLLQPRNEDLDSLGSQCFEAPEAMLADW